tara:strand:- start:589 stop:1413 length:825 start_codon:yes stop_codon:yes gene_type:complete
MIRINGKDVKTFNFSAGEVNPTLPEDLKSGRFKILAYLQSSDDIMNLVMVVDALKRNFGDYPITLTVPYLPYSRQDRLCNKNEAVGLNVIIGMLSGLADTLFSFDIHNFEACGMAGSAVMQMDITNIPVSRILYKNTITTRNTILVAPDQGSISKVLKLSAELGTDYVLGSKKRDTATGKLSGFSVNTLGVDCEGKDLLIVDDICDGGGTFLGLYEELEKLKPKKVDLYVTHGIFSKGYESLLEKFDKIYTTDTFLKDHHESITVIEVVKDVQV